MSEEELNSNALFCKVRDEHEAAKSRKVELIREAHDARLRARVVREYEWKLQDIMDAIKGEAQIK